MNKILLTGASGFLGKYIFQEVSRNNRVITLGRSSNCDYVIDLVENEIKLTEKFDIIIHNAGKAHINPKNNFEIEQFNKVNVIGTINLLSSLEKSGLPKKFVFISSVSVYGLETGTLIKENHILNPKDPYSTTKMKAEKIIQNWCLIKNVNCTILRLPLVIGKNAPGNLKKLINGIKNGIYFNIDKGQAKRSMVLATDVAEYILKASDFDGIFNLTDGYNPSINELSSKIGNELRRPFIYNMPLFIAKKIALIGDIVGDWFPLNSNKLTRLTSTLTFDDSLARISFGWNPKCVLDQIKI
jgi:nucleoside-diphosphate-sugar epimerase